MNASNVKTLGQPEIASAWICSVLNRTNLNKIDHFDLFVFWIENRPSVSRLEFSLPGLVSNIELPISDADAKDNKTVAEQSVVFTARNQWMKESEIGNILDNTDGKSLKVRLLRDEKPVTDWYPVSFFRLDHWVANISNPHSKQLSSTNSPQ